MILSHKHRFIFLAVPKTGTHAVRFALREHLGETDEEQVQLFVQKELPYPEIARIRHGHIRWDEIGAVVPEGVWAGYFKFAFVRNPWERFVSYCAFMHRGTDAFSRDPRGLMRSVLDNPEHRQRVVFQPQHQFICDADGKIMIDHVGRQETMQDSYNVIADRIGVPRQELERKNASSHGPWRDYYDDELKRRVAELYARDIDVFGYSF
jgi:hypothetical protein